MTDHFPLLVPGARPDGIIEVTAPYDCSVIATVDTGGSDAAEQATDENLPIGLDGERANSTHDAGIKTRIQ